MRAIFSSLGAFVAAGLWPRTPLAKAIVFVLAIKLVAVGAVRVYLATDGARPPVDAAAMARVIGVQPAAQ